MERFSRDLAWQWVVEPGFEHTLVDDTQGMRARGTMLARTIEGNPRPYTVRYSLKTDAEWVTTVVEVETEGAGWRRRVRLERPPGGAWRVTASEQGQLDRSLPGIENPEALSGVVDPDIGYSPLFNTLPVRRRGLLGRPLGSSETYRMAFVTIPQLVVAPAEQIYTVLGGGRIRYVSGNFTADLEFDPDGYVRHYPGLATRL